MAKMGHATPENPKAHDKISGAEKSGKFCRKSCWQDSEFCDIPVAVLRKPLE
jgi:hypothetical protein